jgi:hypothetical protein
MELWILIKETVLKFHGVNLKNEDFMEFNLKNNSVSLIKLHEVFITIFN